MKGGKIVIVLVAVIVLGWVIYSLIKTSQSGTLVSDQVSGIAEPVTLPISAEDTQVEAGVATDTAASQNTMTNTDSSYTTASGMKVTITQEGTGAEAKAGNSVSMNYTGKFESGEAFDSNVDPKFGHVQPFVFTIGAGMVIKGWDEGIAGMKVGEKRTLVIPYTLAYGENGYGPIPPKATLIFDVELVSVN
jgi:FKBP-type peptidyl-prolyl cis-trans isomerase